MINAPLKSLPALHRAFAENAVGLLSQQPWAIGVAASGSLAADAMDEFSDLDLTLVVDSDHHAIVLAEAVELAQSLGPLLTAFTGGHVGQPRLLLCLYGPPLLHVDFLFDTLDDFRSRSERMLVLWERDDCLSASTASAPTDVAAPDLQWYEDRFWVWVHKACGKIGRGELFEAIEYLSFLRNKVLGPLIACVAGQPGPGLRKVEQIAPNSIADLQSTLPLYSGDSCLASLKATIDLYRHLRQASGLPCRFKTEAEEAVMAYLNSLTPANTATSNTE